MKKTVMRKITALLSGLGLLLLSQLVSADMALIPGKSDIRFVSIKNTAVAEVHRFTALTGSVNADGDVVVQVSLASVETLIPIRNERMRELLFETVKFPQATVTAKVDQQTVTSLANGAYLILDLMFTLQLHGESKQINAPVSVARLGDEIHVATLQPLLLNAADFQLGAGVERLREIAGLNSIIAVVPVTANLVFAR